MTSAVMPALQKRIDSLDDPICADLLLALRGAEELELLSLAGNSYGLGFFRALAELLRPLRAVRKLNLSDIFVTRKEEIVPSLEALTAALTGKDVRYLDLSCNALCPEGVEAVRALVAGNPLAHLRMDHVALARAGSATLAAAIRDGGLRLRELRLSKNRMEDCAADLAAALAGQTELEELVLFQNAIRGEAMTALLRALAGCPGLRRLDISDNVIDEEHREPLLELLRRCERLEELQLSDCNIGAELADAFFAELGRAHPAALRVLGFDYNDVGSLSVAAEAARGCPALRSFSFKHFEHPAEAVERAAELLDGVECCWESADEEEEEERGELPDMERLMSDLAGLQL